jgi:hypothetical protein
MKLFNRAELARVIVLVAAIALLWLVPPVGFVACAILFVILPPWGKTLTERALISGVVLLGMAAIVFPRASDLLAVNHLNSRIFFALLLAVSYALRLIPGLRVSPYPRIQSLDVFVAIFVALVAYIPISSFKGASIQGVLSSLFHTGWDNHGHFTMFANTFTQQSTLWQTVDGSVAWNQWYPSLHGTFWSLAQFAISDATPGRLALVEPFAIWSAATFALCLGAMAWISGDLAGRLAKHFSLPRYTALVATLGFMVFGFLGSVQLLLSAGFTNFFIAVSVVTTGSYLTARSMKSAQLLGWFVVPLTGIAVIGLWTPLVVAIVPAGVVTVVALWRYRPLMSVIWLSACAVSGVYLVISQSQAVIGASDSNSALDFNSEIGAVGIGMVSFNLALGVAAPFLAVLIAAFIIRALPASKPIIAALLLPVVLVGLLAGFFMFGADSSEVSRLSSYYVLKALDACMLMIIPVLSALAALVLVYALAPTTRVVRILGFTVAGIVALSSFGYWGTNADRLSLGFGAAPGARVQDERHKWIQDDLMGTVLFNAADTSGQGSTFTPILWDASGQLPNLWVASLTGVLSSDQSQLYGELPDFPYDQKTLNAIDFGLNIDGDSRINILWFRPISGELVIPWVDANTTGRVMQQQVPMTKSAVCEECLG